MLKKGRFDMKTFYGISVFILLSVTQVVCAGTLTISTNKQVYSPGEQITISITASGFPSSLEFPTACQADYIMDGIYDSSSGIVCAQVLTGVTLPHTWAKVHSWSRYSPGIGTHLVTAYLRDPWTGFFTSNYVSFSVAVPPPFHVISPNGGEQCVAGSTTTIQWYNYESGYLYDLAYSIDNGQNWLPIASSVSGSSYVWAIPSDVNSSQCLIKASKLASPVVTDVSDNPFTIQIPFQVISPNGGERFVTGSTTTIQWQDYEDEFLYDLKYSADSGQNWQSIVSSISGYSHQWTIPDNINSDQCLVKVIKLTDPNTSDISNNVFTIFECQNPIDGDLNSDCYVNYPDYNIISKNWMRSDCTETNEWCDGSDTYQDGVVDIQDLMLFVEHWLMCGNPFDPAC
jgi:hypothetical protein